MNKNYLAVNLESPVFTKLFLKILHLIFNQRIAFKSQNKDWLMASFLWVKKENCASNLSFCIRAPSRFKKNELSTSTPSLG